jgi:hypothetical protein
VNILYGMANSNETSAEGALYNSLGRQPQDWSLYIFQAAAAEAKRS